MFAYLYISRTRIRSLILLCIWITRDERPTTVGGRLRRIPAALRAPSLTHLISSHAGTAPILPPRSQLRGLFPLAPLPITRSQSTNPRIRLLHQPPPCFKKAPLHPPSPLTTTGLPTHPLPRLSPSAPSLQSHRSSRRAQIETLPLATSA